MTARSKPEDYVGKRYGFLLINDLFIDTTMNRSRASCTCDCGNKVSPLLKDLKRGVTVSCGCFGNAKRLEGVSSHKMSGTNAYQAWVSMIQRCTNPKNACYKDYGGRGISFYPLWRSFEEFHKCVGDPPKGGTLDRVDVNKGYEPDNVRWADRKTQSRNKRNNRMLTHNGKTMCVADWVDETGLRSSLIINRIDYLGWSVADALTVKPRERQS